MPSPSRLVIVANRLPVNRVRRAGASAWETSPGGLVSALVPTLQRTGGSWIGWTGTTGTAPEPFEHDGIRNVPVPISRRELDAYYNGFANSTLWPLYHDAVRPATFHRAWWRPYVDVNRRFAEATAAQARRGDLVWVQDYHLQLVPAMLRELRPDLRIGFFLHIPFPPQELFSQLPWRGQLLRGILGADVVGCQTRVGAQNFCQLATRFVGVKRSGRRLEHEGREVRVGAYPISIDFRRFEEIASRPEVQADAAQLREELGKDRFVFLGVDRLDYTKGIDRRVQAYGELIERGELGVDDSVLVQTAVPSREHVAEYQELRDEVELLVGRINGEHSRIGRNAVHYLHRNLPVERLVAFYLAADAMLVTPLRDGMNLVCKEFVASRVWDDGVLVLSEFTGAAHELRGSLLVNPHDIDGLAETMLAATRLQPGEVRRRMRSLRRIVRANDVHRWARTFLDDLAG